MSVISFENVAYSYGGGELLSDVSLKLAPGSFHFLTGPSGAGKTTLLKLVFLSERPVRGAISMFGKDVARLRRGELPALRRQIGVVFQDFRLLDHLTAFENVALPLRIQGMPERAYREDVEEILNWVGLGERMHARPATLSGGEKQRIAIARAVVARPPVLVADEPTGSIDPEMGARLMRLFVELNKLGTTVLIATHDRSLVDNAKARELRLFAGRISQAGGARWS